MIEATDKMKRKLNNKRRLLTDVSLIGIPFIKEVKKFKKFFKLIPALFIQAIIVLKEERLDYYVAHPLYLEMRAVVTLEFFNAENLICNEAYRNLINNYLPTEEFLQGLYKTLEIYD